MGSETAQSSGWRCWASWLHADDETSQVTVELDRNMGGMWPRVVVVADAQTSQTTSVAVASASVSQEEFVAASGMTYRRGIDESCVAALLQGAVIGLGKAQAVQINVTSGGVAGDTAEMICRRAAQIATMLLVERLTETRPLEETLTAAVETW